MPCCRKRTSACTPSRESASAARPRLRRRKSRCENRRESSNHQATSYNRPMDMTPQRPDRRSRFFRNPHFSARFTSLSPDSGSSPAPAQRPRRIGHRRRRLRGRRVAAYRPGRMGDRRLHYRAGADPRRPEHGRGMRHRPGLAGNSPAGESRKGSGGGNGVAGRRLRRLLVGLLDIGAAPLWIKVLW